MKLFGKEMTGNQVKQLMNRSTKEENECIMKSLYIQNQMEAERRMKVETDPNRKEYMKRLISKEVYNFDLIFGPEI